MHIEAIGSCLQDFKAGIAKTKEPGVEAGSWVAEELLVFGKDLGRQKMRDGGIRGV